MKNQPGTLKNNLYPWKTIKLTWAHENQPKSLKTYQNRHGTMKNQSGAIKTNLELYRVVMGGSSGYRRLTGGSDDFSLQTDKHCIIIYISSPLLSSSPSLSSASSLSSPTPFLSLGGWGGDGVGQDHSSGSSGSGNANSTSTWSDLVRVCWQKEIWICGTLTVKIKLMSAFVGRVRNPVIHYMDSWTSDQHSQFKL